MKKLMLSMLFIIPILLWSQERINKALPQMSLPLSVLDNADGYVVDGAGQWSEGSKNKINGIDSFIKYEFRTITYRNESYLLFIKYKRSWYYKYPAIKEGMEFYTSIHYYLIDIDSYKDIISKVINNNIIEFDVLYSNSKSDDVSGIEQDLLMYFSGNYKPLNSIKLIFQMRLFRDKNIAQFLFFTETCSISGRAGKKKKNKLLDCFYSGLENNYIEKVFPNALKTDNLYNNFYYETTFNKLNDFLDIRNVVSKPSHDAIGLPL